MSLNQSDYKSNIEFATNLMMRMKLMNSSLGIHLGQALWVHNRLRAIEVNITQQIADMFPETGLASLIGVPLTIDLMNLVISGDVEVAYICLLACEPDAGTEPYHFLVADAIAWIRHEIGKHLAWEA